MAERKYRDIEIGERFYNLTVEGFGRKPGSKSRQLYYYCRCDCGNMTYVRRRELITETTRSCGCKRWKNAQLIGTKVNKLTVLAIDDTKERAKGKHTYLLCQCECGNTISTRGSYLRDRTIIDCGCGHGKRISEGMTQDVGGKVFGHLHVIERDWSYGTQSGQHARWLCKCDICGRIESVSSTSLIRYGKDRCRVCSGMSNGEQKICELLDNMDIEYDNDVPYKNCVYPETSGKLRFDFVIHSSPEYLIEYDGEQHYKKVRTWESKIDLDGRKSRDEYKNKWCSENDVPLIRIPYTHLSKICEKDLLLETSEFIVKN